MKNLITLVILLATGFNAYAQSTLIWSEDFTTELEEHYKEYPEIQANGDTITVIGWKNTDNGQQLLLMVKYDLNGEILSTQLFGEDSVMQNSLIAYKFDALNNVYLLHKEQLEFYKSKIVLQKYSPDGQLIWVEEMVSSADTSYAPKSIELANDNSLFISGYKEHNYPEEGDDIFEIVTVPFLSLIDMDGVEQWRREFNADEEISWFAHDIFVNDETAFLFGGFGRLVKVDLNNTITVIDDTGLDGGVGEVQLSLDGNLLITSFFKYRLSKVTLDGSIIWSTYYGTNLPANVSADEIRSIVQDSEGSIYLTGRHHGEGYGTPAYTRADILTIKYNNEGEMIWDHRYAYEVDNSDIANCIALRNGNVYVGGESQRLGFGTDLDYVVLKIDSAQGTLNGVYRYNGFADGDDSVYDLEVLSNDSLILTGLSFIDGSFNWTTQLLSDVVLSTSNLQSHISVDVFPNPIQTGQLLTIRARGFTHYSIISPSGQLVQQGRLDANELNSIDLENIEAGLYLLDLISESQRIGKKIVVK